MNDLNRNMILIFVCFVAIVFLVMTIAWEEKSNKPIRVQEITEITNENETEAKNEAEIHNTQSTQNVENTVTE